MDYVISEIVQVRIGGRWYDAEILDITPSIGIYVYVFDLRAKKNIRNSDIR
jgi:hypothetical protein